MRKFTRNNQGVALITVIIGVMFCLLLTSTMLRVSLLGLQSRSINNQVSDTFYDSENVVDTIRLNLQNTAARAWATTNNDATSSKAFVAETYRLITGKTYPETGSLSLSSSEKATAIANLTANAIQGGTVTDIGNIERFTGDTGKLEGIKIKDVEVKYENPKTKMVSYVKTDITIRAPLYASKKKYPLASYSMFAGSGASLWNTNSHQGQYGNPNQFGFLEQEGNVYIGYEASGTTAITINGRETFILSGGNVVINGDIVVKDYSNLQLTADDVEVRGKITLQNDNCHLVIGTATNLKCQDIVIGGKSIANGDYTFTSGGNIYYGTPYRCYTTWTKPDGSAKVGGLNDGTKHNGTISTPAYKTSGSVTYYPNYVDNASSIVYIDSNNLTTAYAYDAYVYGKSQIKTQSGAMLTVTTDPDDSELKRRPRRDTQRVVTETDNGGYKSKHGQTYDDYFLEIIDLEYFEGFMYDEFSTTQNHPVQNRIKSSVYNPDAEKNEPDSADAFEGTQIKKQGKTDDEGNSISGTEEFESVTYSGIDYSYTAYDGTTKKYKNPRVAVVFTGNNNSGNGNLVHSSDRPFVVSNYTVEFHVDQNDADYCGIIFTSKKVELKKDNGYCAGKSLLNLDTDSNLANLKVLMDTIGAHMSSTNNVTNKKYVIFNNLFNGGIKRFYERPSSGNSNYQIDITHNKNMDLVDLENFEKK
jgi:hypothetical protein